MAMVWITFRSRQENYKKESENGNEGSISSETINIQHVFIWNSQKYIPGKTNIDFPNKIQGYPQKMRLQRQPKTSQT